MSTMAKFSKVQVGDNLVVMDARGFHHEVTVQYLVPNNKISVTSNNNWSWVFKTNGVCVSSVQGVLFFPEEARRMQFADEAFGLLERITKFLDLSHREFKSLIAEIEQFLTKARGE